MPTRRKPNHRVIRLGNRPTTVFVTVCTLQREPLLATHAMHQLLRQVWSESTAWLVGRYVVMPDHVHLFAAPGEQDLPLTNWVAFWKRLSSRRAGRSLWQTEYWDTTLRDVTHAKERRAYVAENPVRGGLVTRSVDWPHQGELFDLPWR